MLDIDNETILKKLKVKQCPFCGGKIKKLKDFFEVDSYLEIVYIWKTVYKCTNCKHQFHLLK